jgi:hypothetical protein
MANSVVQLKVPGGDAFPITRLADAIDFTSYFVRMGDKAYPITRLAYATDAKSYITRYKRVLSPADLDPEKFGYIDTAAASNQVTFFRYGPIVTVSVNISVNKVAQWRKICNIPVGYRIAAQGYAAMTAGNVSFVNANPFTIHISDPTSLLITTPNTVDMATNVRASFSWFTDDDLPAA